MFPVMALMMKKTIYPYQKSITASFGKPESKEPKPKPNYYQKNPKPTLYVWNPPKK